METVFHEHFPFLFEALKHNKGQSFSQLASIPVPENDAIRVLLFLELWDFALRHDATDAFHTLILYTQNDMLEHALRMCVRKHAFMACVGLLAKLEQRDGEGTVQRLPSLACASHCQRCWAMRHWMLEFLPLPMDWTVCRVKMANARANGTWTMHKPKLALSTETDAVFNVIQATSKQGWSCLFAACACVSMWKRWMEKRLDPGSTFVNSVLSRRFNEFGMQLQWGGETEEEE